MELLACVICRRHKQTDINSDFMTTNDRQVRLSLARLPLAIVFILIEARGASITLVRRARSAYGGDWRRRHRSASGEWVACGGHGRAGHGAKRAAVPVQVRRRGRRGQETAL